MPATKTAGIQLATMITLQEKVCVNASYQDSRKTAGNNDYCVREGMQEGQLLRQPDENK